VQSTKYLEIGGLIDNVSSSPLVHLFSNKKTINLSPRSALDNEAPADEVVSNPIAGLNLTWAQRSSARIIAGVLRLHGTMQTCAC